MTESIYDICVVGAGMVGSAAAKWLSKLHPEMKVSLIGPQEPTEEEWQKREIFSAHYDEGRLTRELDESLLWALLAQRSIQEYRNIEKESGINFYHEVGCAFIDAQNEESLQSMKQNAEKMGVTSYEALDTVGLQAQFPYLHVEPNWQVLFNFKNAGYISARNIVAAQQKIAASHGCDVINDVVVKVQEDDDGGDGFLNVVCQSEREVTAKRVLLCTGAFSNCYGLLPEGKQIDFEPLKIFVVKPEVSEEYATKLADMPSLIVNLPGKSSYILPPIRYPDGKYYLKIGAYQKTQNVASGLQDMAEWFRSEAQHEDQKDSTLDILKFLVPDLEPISVTTSRCVISYTPSHLLYCDMITPRLGALVGMSGQGAKSSDEIGKMGAQMIAKGSWDYDLPAEHFKIRLKTTGSAKA